jgi:hypothetical protein
MQIDVGPLRLTLLYKPYAVRHASDIINHTPGLRRGHTPISAFPDADVRINSKHGHPFGAPVYVLDNDLQAKKKAPKWKQRSRVCIYLGRSPQHASTVALVLSL